MGSRKSRRGLKATAFHEAGHAVMAWTLGVRLKRVSVVPSKNAAGECHYGKLSQSKHFEVGDSDRVRLRTEKLIMVALAGSTAQQLYSPRSYHHYQAKSDYDTVAQLALSITGPPKETNAYLKWLEIRTRETLRLPWHWDAVKAMAEALIKRGTVSSREAKQVIRQATGLSVEESLPKNAEQRKSERDCLLPTAQPAMLTFLRFGRLLHSRKAWAAFLTPPSKLLDNSSQTPPLPSPGPTPLGVRLGLRRARLGPCPCV